MYCAMWAEVIGNSGSALILAATMALCVMAGQQPDAVNPPDAASQRELFEHGQRALSEARYAEAERDFDQLLRIGLRSAPVYSNLGVVYLRTGRFDRAIEVLRKARKLSPGMAGVSLNLGLAYYKKREFAQAVPSFAAVVSADPANIQARYLEGVCHFMMDEFDAAAKALGPIAEQERDDLDYLFMLGISYGKLGRASDAEHTFSRLMEAGGDTPHLHLLLGKAYLALDHDADARAELEKAAAGSRLPYAHYYLGVLDRKTGRLEPAAEQFAMEIEISPNDPWAYDDLTRIKLDQGDVDGAISLLEQGVVRNPDSPALLAALAKAYLRKSLPERAIPRLHRAIELDPENGNYHYQLGRAYLRTGRKREANIEMAKARALQVRVLKGQMEALSRDRASP